jgi:DNA polymerase-3 subunit gamma/tau
MALYHTYRPNLFKDLLGQDHVSQTLKNALVSSKIAHGYLFSGPRGSGKTSTARILAKALNCLQLKDGELCGDKCVNCLLISQGKALDILEIDAASNRGIDDIRELREHVKFAPNQLNYKVVIIDEVHMLTKEAFNALLKTLEEPPSHVVFIMATTEAHKVSPTILSRVQRFDFKLAGIDILAKNLLSISAKEKINLTKDGANLLSLLAEGSFRDSVTLLDQVSATATDKIDEAYIRNILGLSDEELINSFFDAIESNNRAGALKIVDDFLSQGGDPGSFVGQAVNKARELLRQSADDRILVWLKGLLKANEQLKFSPYPVLPLEIFIAEQCFPLKSTGEIRERVEPKAIAKEKVMDVRAPEAVPVVEEKIEHLPNSTIEDISKKEPIDNPVKPEKSVEKTQKSNFNENNWHEMIEELKKENTSLAAILKDSHLAEALDDNLKIAVKFKFHADKISDRKNQLIIESALEKLTGQAIRISCIVDPNFVKFREVAETTDLVSDALSVFEEI